MQELTLQTMKNMLQKQRKMYETLSVNYSKSPSEKLEKDLQDCESIVKLLESEIASKSPPIDVRAAQSLLCLLLFVYIFLLCGMLYTTAGSAVCTVCVSVSSLYIYMHVNER